MPPERSTRRTSESHREVSATCSITSPAHTTSKLASSKRQRPFRLDEPHVQIGVARERAAQRLGGDVNRHHLGAGADERGREVPLAAADVEHPRRTAGALRRRRHPLEQERLAQARSPAERVPRAPPPRGLVVGAQGIAANR